MVRGEVTTRALPATGLSTSRIGRTEGLIGMLQGVLRARQDEIDQAQRLQWIDIRIFFDQKTQAVRKLIITKETEDTP